MKMIGAFSARRQACAIGRAQLRTAVKAKAVEYVKICSLYGAGFFYIPGTDTCIKLGGYLRAETAFNSTNYNGAFSGQLGAHNRLSNYYSMRSRQNLTVDTRTATEYGVVRTFFDANFTWTSGSYGSTAPVVPFTPRVRRAVALVALLTPLTVVFLAARLASTMRSSSSPDSRWAGRFLRSMRPGSTIPATTSTAWSAAAARPMV